MTKKKQGRNDPCDCGSGLKYKYCCISGERRSRPVLINKPCESCGNPLEIDLMDDFMNAYAASMFPLKNFCKDNDFYLFGLTLSIGKVEEFSNKLEAGNLTKKDFIDEYKDSLKKSAVIELTFPPKTEPLQS